MIDPVTFLSAKFQHLLPVGLLILVFGQTEKLQYFCCDKLLFNNVKVKQTSAESFAAYDFNYIKATVSNICFFCQLRCFFRTWILVMSPGVFTLWK